MMEIDIENIKEVWFNWDYQVAVIPNKYIKRLKCSESKNGYYSTYCNSVVIEMDLEYIKTHKYYYGNNIESYRKDNIGPDSDATIFDRLQSKHIWSIQVMYNNVEKSMELSLPSNRKDNYCGETTPCPYCDWCTENLCEHHKIENNSYIIEWIEPTEKDIYMNTREMSMFFKKDNLSSISTYSHDLAIELVERILALNMKKDCITNKIEELSKKHDGPIVCFKTFKEDIIKVVRKMHNVGYPKSTIYGIKRGYRVLQEYYPLHGIDISIVNAKNHSHNWNFNFILIPKIDNEKDKNAIYKVIYAGVPNEDTKNRLSRNILIFNDDINIEKFMLEFYIKTYKNTSKIDILNEKLLFATYKEINKIWYYIHKEWELL